MHVPTTVNLAEPATFTGILGAENMPLCKAQGMFFLADATMDRAGGWWRIYNGSENDHLPELRNLLFLYGAKSFMWLRFKMGTIPNRQQGHDSRTQNRSGTTQRVTDVNRDFVIPDHGLGLDADEIRLHRYGEGLFGILPDEEAEGRNYANGDVSDMVNTILAQFAADVIQNAPNRKALNGATYLTLPLADRPFVTLALFKQAQVPLDCMWAKVVSANFWNETQFERLFPAKGSPQFNRQRQNFSRSEYLMKWYDLMLRLTEASANKVREAVKKVYLELWWTPHTESDKLWATSGGKKTQSYKWFGQALEGTAPLIAVNPRYQREFGHGQFKLGNPGMGPEGDDDDDDEAPQGPPPGGEGRREDSELEDDLPHPVHKTVILDGESHFRDKQRQRSERPRQRRRPGVPEMPSDYQNVGGALNLGSGRGSGNAGASGSGGGSGTLSGSGIRTGGGGSGSAGGSSARHAHTRAQQELRPPGQRALTEFLNFRRQQEDGDQHMDYRGEDAMDGSNWADFDVGGMDPRMERSPSPEEEQPRQVPRQRRPNPFTELLGNWGEHGSADEGEESRTLQKTEDQTGLTSESSSDGSLEGKDLVEHSPFRVAGT